MGNSVASNVLGRVGGRHILGSAANHNGKLHLRAAAATAVGVGERRWHWTVAMFKHATPVYYSCGGALYARACVSYLKVELGSDLGLYNVHARSNDGAGELAEQQWLLGNGNILLCDGHVTCGK